MQKITSLIKSLQFWLSLAVGLMVLGFSVHSYFGQFANAQDVKDLQKSLSRSKETSGELSSKVELLDYKISRVQESLDMILENTLQIGSKIKAPNLKR